MTRTKHLARLERMYGKKGMAVWVAAAAALTPPLVSREVLLLDDGIWFIPRGGFDKPMIISGTFDLRDEVFGIYHADGGWLRAFVAPFTLKAFDNDIPAYRRAFAKLEDTKDLAEAKKLLAWAQRQDWAKRRPAKRNI